MTDFSRILASSPVNAQAARQLSRGEDWEPAVVLSDYFADRPAIRAISADTRRNPEFVDFTGRTFGRLTVVGLMDKGSNTPASWVCRCQCGGYCSRRAKSLKVADRGGNSFKPMCGRCDYIIKLRDGWSPSIGRAAQ